MTIDQIDLQDIYEFMEKGDVANAPPEIVAYLQILDKTRGMLDRIDKWSNDEAIVKHLVLVDGLSRYKAKKFIDEAREYFFKDDFVSKKAWKNIYAAKAEKALNFAMLTMKDVKDAVAIIKAIKDIEDIRGVNDADVEDLPAELFLPRVRLYSLDARISEFASPADRNKLSKLIDALPELSEREKSRMKQEALCEFLTIFPDEQENVR